jgi:stringent starvation protein B
LRWHNLETQAATTKRPWILLRPFKRAWLWSKVFTTKVVSVVTVVGLRLPLVIARR